MWKLFDHFWQRQISVVHHYDASIDLINAVCIVLNNRQHDITIDQQLKKHVIDSMIDVSTINYYKIWVDSDDNVRVDIIFQDNNTLMLTFKYDVQPNTVEQLTLNDITF